VKIKRDALVEIMQDAGLREDQLHIRGYGAFGQQCPGIEVRGLPQLAEFFNMVGQAEADRGWVGGPDASDLTHGVCMDTVGNGLVFFWPELELED
jgi:hypothetical protein